MAADLCDQADQTSEFLLTVAMNNHHHKPRGPQPTGACHNCKDDVDAGCFCDADCREDWEKRARNKRT